MPRIFALIQIAMLSCLVTTAVAQEGWRSSQTSQPVQSGQNQGQITSAWQVPGPAAMQNFPNQAQYSNSGNYDLPTQPTANSQQPQVTRQTQISLPFKITSANQDKLSSVELIYSMDRGQNWYSYQHLPPTETNFDFNAPHDGEYWFVYRAVHKIGAPQQFGPTLRVLVDTVPPKLTLDARRNSSGEVTVEWSAEDVALKNTPPTISLSYDSNATWMTLAVDRKNVKREGSRETGHVAFWPRHDAEAVEIRCELEDAAENKEILTKRLVLKPSQNESASETAMVPATEVTPTFVQPVPDVTVMPPKPVVMNTSHSPPAVSETTPASDNTLNDLLQIMGGAAPLPVSADVTQRYANHSGNAVAQPPPNTLQMVGPNGNRAPVVSTETPPFPGKIISVWKGRYDEQPCIIVRWMSGGIQFADSKVDLYRSETKHGPWRPIAFDLQNKGEHFWLVSAADMMPFYLRVDLRSTQGLFTDFTVETIALPLSLNDPAPTTQQNMAASTNTAGTQASQTP